MEPATASKSISKIYGYVTDRIIAQLEKGTVPWQKPWTVPGIPRNVISNRPYRGINILLLASLGFEQNLFLTYKQLKELGGSVRKDEKPHMVVYWNYKEKEAGDEEHVDEENGKRQAAYLRYYYVYNIAQCENVPKQYIPKVIVREARPIPACKKIVKDMPDPPRIGHREQYACYYPFEDRINMPKQATFKSDESYYCTLFHELVHSTGHPRRLNRNNLMFMSEWMPGAAYSQEELIAEIGACFLQSVTGITSEFEQSAAYIQAWLERLRNDKKFIVSASAYAQKAVDFILDVKQVEEPEEEK